MIEPIKIWDNDHQRLVQLLMDEIPLSIYDMTRQQITAAYAAGYEKQSDGGTLIGQMEFQGFSIKNPFFVNHDWEYFMGMKNPFLSKTITTEVEARRWDDGQCYVAMNKFGHYVLSTPVWIGLRFGAQAAWDAHRKAGHPDNAKYDANGMLTFEAMGVA